MRLAFGHCARDARKHEERRMQRKGRKNAAGGWLLGEMTGRAAGVVSAGSVVAGFAWGLLFGGAPLVANLVQASPWWSALGSLCVIGLAYGVVVLVLRRTRATWGRGLAAERRVGDRIEHALVRPGCAFAHDVKEALGGPGNVDHVVLTPLGVWVAETKSGWLDKAPFTNALRQTAANVERVRRNLNAPGVPVRGALVIADNQELYEADHDWKGEPVAVFRVVSFWRRLQQECGADGRRIEIQEGESLARKVWSLGSTRHLDS